MAEAKVKANSKKVVATMLKVHSRVSHAGTANICLSRLSLARTFCFLSFRCPGDIALALLEDMDSRHAGNHCLNLSVLDTLCGKTAVPKNETLQDALLLWVLEGLHYDISREVLEVTESRDSVLKATGRLLLQRRLVLFFCVKFRFSISDATDSKINGQQDRTPAKVLISCFGSYEAFRNSHLHAAGSLNPQSGTEQVSLTWLGRLPESQQLVIGALCSLLTGNAAIDGFLKTCVAVDMNMSAEAALATSAWKTLGLADVDALMEKRNAEINALSPAVLQDVVDAKAEADDEAMVDRATAEMEDDCPEPELKGADVVRPCRSTYFPGIVIANIVVDVLNKVQDDEVFREMLHHALVRAELDSQAHRDCVHMNITCLCPPPPQAPTPTWTSGHTAPRAARRLLQLCRRPLSSQAQLRPF